MKFIQMLQHRALNRRNEKKDIVEIKEKIKEVKGVENVIWTDDALDISVPKEIFPDAVKNQLFNEDSTMVIIKYKNSYAEKIH